jgi:cystathionine gamma-synthase
MSYWDYAPALRQSWGITESLVRLACGIESTEDLIADMDQALEKV